MSKKSLEAATNFQNIPSSGKKRLEAFPKVLKISKILANLWNFEKCWPNSQKLYEKSRFQEKKIRNDEIQKKSFSLKNLVIFSNECSKLQNQNALKQKQFKKNDRKESSSQVILHLHHVFVDLQNFARQFLSCAFNDGTK